MGIVIFVPYGDLDALANAIDEDTAGVIMEPIQGIAGLIEPPANFLQEVEKKLCKRKGIVFICDEIQSGMGRTGHPLLSTYMGAKPDIVTLGKGLGSGFPVSAVLMTESIAKV